MLWTFGEFEFNEDTRVLTHRKEELGENGLIQKELVLEPKVASLLQFFCQNPQRNISREELFSQVWHQQFVTDNAINRVVGLLRKALGDEDKVKQYIVTVPKIGYRFTQIVNYRTEIEAENKERASASPQQTETNANQTIAKPKSKKSLQIFGSILLLIIVFALGQTFIATEQEQLSNNNPRVSPLTRLSSGQSDGVVSNDGQQLIYVSYHAKEQFILMQKLPDGLPQKISRAGGRASNGNWSYDDSRLVYKFRSGNVCQFHQVDFINGIAQSPRSIYQCQTDSVTDFAYSEDNKTLYFVERAHKYSAYFAYSLDIATGEKQLLPQPNIPGNGNHQFDFNVQTGKFLLLGNHQTGETTFYDVNLTDNSYQRLLTFDYSIEKAVWGHQTGTVVHQGPHPSSQLMLTNIDNAKSTVLVSDTRRIDDVKRINNKRDYSFTSLMFNRDIYLNTEGGNDFNSSVNDFLPALSHVNNSLAFISKRSGRSKVWLKINDENHLLSIDSPDRGRSFYSLQWSFDDKYLLANTNKGLIIYDVALLSVANVITLPRSVFGVKWSSINEIMYSRYENDQWQLYKYNVNTSTETALHKRWAFGVASATQTVMIDQQMNLFLDGTKALTAISCRNPIHGHALTIGIDGDDLYCISRDNSAELLRLENMKTLHKQAQELRSMGHYDYSVSGKQHALTKLKSVSSDIMRTNF
ncbi:MAG: winged helix-turn-helix domain-containing protein [Colwellia sp.]|nr:winged helix-turn-helix domain-containing protein [Colwellia sp.]